jgi:hypothetical protein
MIEDQTDRRPDLHYEDDHYESDDQPARTPYHGPGGSVTLPQAAAAMVRCNTPTAYPAAVPRTRRDAARASRP